MQNSSIIESDFEHETPQGDVTTIAVAYSVPEAIVMQATLRAYNIPHYVTALNHAYTDWYMTRALGGMEIRVPVSMAQDASSLISFGTQPKPRTERIADIKKNGGPYIRKRLIAATVSVWLLSLLFSFMPFILFYVSDPITPLVFALYLAIHFALRGALF